MRLKLFKKYFLTTSLIIVFSLGFLMMILSIVLNNYIVTSKQETMEKACLETVEHINLDTEKQKADLKELGAVVRPVAKISNLDIFIADANGNVVLCGCDEWAQKGDCMHSIEAISIDLLDAKEDDKDFFLSDLGVYQKPHYVSSLVSRNADGKRYGTVFATAPVSIVKKLLSATTKLYVFSAIAPIIIMFFFIYIMTYRMTKPLKLMSEASKAMARGDFSKRVPVMSDDEIGELSASFNMMTNSLARLESMRKSFVADVSHELKTPMTTIGGFIDGILDGTIEPEKHKYYLGIVSEEIKRLLVFAVNTANTVIFEKSDSDEELYGMGTTVVVLFICDNTLYTASVGDSRAYVFNGNRAHQITTDHSLVADLLSRGIISEEEAKNHPQKNVITRAVGSEPNLTVDVFQTNLDSDNIIVGCSDGLYSLVSEEEISVIINDNIENSAEKLIKLANEKGGQDNITVVVAKIS